MTERATSFGGRADVRAGLLRVHGHDGRAGRSGHDPMVASRTLSFTVSWRCARTSDCRSSPSARRPARRSVEPAQRAISGPVVAVPAPAPQRLRPPVTPGPVLVHRDEMQFQRADERQDPVEVRLVDHLPENDHLLGSIDDDEAVELAPGTFGERSLYPELERCRIGSPSLARTGSRTFLPSTRACLGGAALAPPGQGDASSDGRVNHRDRNEGQNCSPWAPRGTVAPLRRRRLQGLRVDARRRPGTCSSPRSCAATTAPRRELTRAWCRSRCCATTV